MLMVNPADFASLFTKGLVFNNRISIIEGLPADAEVLTIAADPLRGGVILVVQSNEYEAIPINVQPPIQVVSINVGK